MNTIVSIGQASSMGNGIKKQRDWTFGNLNTGLNPRIYRSIKQQCIALDCAPVIMRCFSTYNCRCGGSKRSCIMVLVSIYRLIENNLPFLVHVFFTPRLKSSTFKNRTNFFSRFAANCVRFTPLARPVGIYAKTTS